MLPRTPQSAANHAGGHSWHPFPSAWGKPAKAGSEPQNHGASPEHSPSGPSLTRPASSPSPPHRHRRSSFLGFVPATPFRTRRLCSGAAEGGLKRARRTSLFQRAASSCSVITSANCNELRGKGKGNTQFSRNKIPTAERLLFYKDRTRSRYKR